MGSRSIPEIEINQLEPKQTIGRGSYGQVIKAMYKGKLVAMKVPLDESPEGRKQLMNEMAELYGLRHKNIIEVIGMCSGKKLTFIMELMDDGSLEDLIHKHFHLVYTVDHVLSWAKQCADAMCFLHRKSLMHRDFKPANLLLKDSYHLLKLCDFGTITLLRTTKLTYSNNRGSPLWMAPEVFKSSRYNLKCDVYSFGITLWEMLTRKLPFCNHFTPCTSEPYTLIFRIVTQNLQPPVLAEPFCPAVISQLITRCSDHNPSARPTMEEVYETLIEFSRAYPNSRMPLEQRETTSDSGENEACASESEDSFTLSQVRSLPRSQSSSPSQAARRPPPKPEPLQFLDKIIPELRPIAPKNVDDKSQKLYYEQVAACQDLCDIESKLREALKIKHRFIAQMKNLETTVKLIEEKEDLKDSLQEFRSRMATQRRIPPTPF